MQDILLTFLQSLSMLSKMFSLIVTFNTALVSVSVFLLLISTYPHSSTIHMPIAEINIHQLVIMQTAETLQ